MSTRHLVIAVLALFGASTSGKVAVAQSDSAEDVFVEARGRYDAGDYESAVRLFRQAFAHSGSPVAQLYIARSVRAMGQPLRAADEYALSADIAASSSEERYQRVRQTALVELDQLAAGYAELLLPSDALETGATLVVGDRRVPLGTMRVRVLAPTAGVLVQFESDNCRTFRERLSLAAGERYELALSCGEEPTVVAPPTPTPPTVDPVPESDVSPEPGRNGPAIALSAVTAASLLVGSSLQVTAGSIHSQLSSECRVGCPDDATERVDRGQRFEHTSIGLFVLAGVSLATAIILFLVSGDDAEPAIRF